VFYAWDGNNVTILAIHVDDCLITGSSEDLIAHYKQCLDSTYSLTDLGPIYWLLGIKITHDHKLHTISLTQMTYINTILNCFSLGDAKPYTTLIVPSMNYSKKDSPTNVTKAAYMAKVPYCEAIGSLMYATVATHPNITFAVSTLSQFLKNPGQTHWEAVKRVFCYLSSTKTHALTYRNKHHDLIGFTDADGASQEHCHAISGFAFLIDSRAVSWASKKQELVALSTTEAEYIAATHAARECIWLCRLTRPLSPPFPTTVLYCDNQAALCLATDNNYHTCTKHIDIRYHFICQTIARKYIAMEYCLTENQTADILTKALPKYKTVIHVQNLGIRQA
jgi:Reverse transcriptase (RNA-dependent DNA polymerase)